MEVIDGITWDFGPNDLIEYFDTSKSYYLSKYRPINDTMGLDFNPDWFRETAITKLTTGKYSNLTIGSHSHRVFWEEQKRRCTEGYTVNGYTITGDNYFWLNFYRLKLDNINGKASGGRSVSFPTFYVFQYEYFHYLELCELLKYDVGLVKARGLGFSEIGACLCIRPYTTTPNYRVLASAPSKRHLDPLISKMWAQMNFLNSETETAFKRVRMVINTNTYRRASKKDKKGEESGHMSEIECVIADTPEKIRGDRTERLLFEEAGSDPHFQKKYLQGEALVTIMGGKRMGTRIAWGTGGDTGDAVEGLKNLAVNPLAYNILPFKHNYTKDEKYVFTSMFIPAYRIITDDSVHLVDSRGWCNREAGMAYYNQKRLLKASDPKGLLIYESEYCFTLDEAFLLQGNNIFPREELADQLTELEIYKSVSLPTAGYLTWDRNEDDTIIGVKWRNDPAGNILILEHPLKSTEGTNYKNLYVGGIDSIDIGTADSTGTDKNPSSFCIVIKKRIFGTQDPKYVALYKHRPKDPREAYENAAKLLMYYSCQAVLESTRTAIVTHFRNKKWLHLLMKRPRSTLPDVTKGNSNMYGSPATLKVIGHYRELIYDFALDYSYTIAFREMLMQLLNYSDERKKDFDIIAAMGMCELGDEELSVKVPTAQEPEGKAFRDVGWWKDSKGYRHYGAIPLTEEERNDRTRVSTSDSWLYDELV